MSFTISELLNQAHEALDGNSSEVDFMVLTDFVDLFETPILTVPDKQGRNVAYFLWTDGHAVGFRVERIGTDKVEYIYLNPSNNDDGSDDPNVFIYSGEHGNPAEDTPWHHYVQDFGDDEQEDDND